jgi:hypothetical protein
MMGAHTMNAIRRAPPDRPYIYVYTGAAVLTTLTFGYHAYLSFRRKGEPPVRYVFVLVVSSHQTQ